MTTLDSPETILVMLRDLGAPYMQIDLLDPDLESCYESDGRYRLVVQHYAAFCFSTEHLGTSVYYFTLTREQEKELCWELGREDEPDTIRDYAWCAAHSAFVSECLDCIWDTRDFGDPYDEFPDERCGHEDHEAKPCIHGRYEFPCDPCEECLLDEELMEFEAVLEAEEPPVAEAVNGSRLYDELLDEHMASRFAALYRRRDVRYSRHIRSRNYCDTRKEQTLRAQKAFLALKCREPERLRWRELMEPKPGSRYDRILLSVDAVARFVFEDGVFSTLPELDELLDTPGTLKMKRCRKYGHAVEKRFKRRLARRQDRCAMERELRAHLDADYARELDELLRERAEACRHAGLPPRGLKAFITDLPVDEPDEDYSDPEDSTSPEDDMCPYGAVDCRKCQDAEDGPWDDSDQELMDSIALSLLY